VVVSLQTVFCSGKGTPKTPLLVLQSPPRKKSAIPELTILELHSRNLFFNTNRRIQISALCPA
jgi:hypothetical protein